LPIKSLEVTVKPIDVATTLPNLIPDPALLTSRVWQSSCVTILSFENPNLLLQIVDTSTSSSGHRFDIPNLASKVWIDSHQPNPSSTRKPASALLTSWS
jgi:hypothetical protein